MVYKAPGGKKNPLGKPYGIWTNKQGDWRTIHRRSFYNFDITKDDYEEKYDGLQVWRHQKHPLHASLFPEGEIVLTDPQKKAIIKGWLNDKRENKDNWKNMVMYNLRQSLVPLVVELNKGKGSASDINSPDSQMAILKNILANKFRFQHYIGKIFGEEATLGDGTTKTADWDKVKNSYKEINQNIAGGEINYEELKNYFNNIFIQGEGFLESDVVVTHGGCWPNCGRKKKRREDGTKAETEPLFNSSLDEIKVDSGSGSEDNSDLENMFDNLDDSEGEDGSDVNDKYDEYIDINIVNMSNVMSTFIDDETKQGKLDWDALHGKEAWEIAELVVMEKRRFVKIPRKPIVDENAAKKKIEDLEVFIDEINKDEDEFFNGDMTLSFNLAEHFNEHEPELDTSVVGASVLANLLAKKMADFSYEVDFDDSGRLITDNVTAIKIKQKKLNFVRQVLKWKLQNEVTSLGELGDNEEGELKNKIFKMIFEKGRVISEGKGGEKGDKSTLLEDYQDFRLQEGSLHDDIPIEYINELQGNLGVQTLKVKEKILKSTIFWKNLVNIIDDDNFEYFEDMIDNYFEDKTYLKFLNVNNIDSKVYKNVQERLLKRSYPETRILLQAKKLQYETSLLNYIEKKVPKLNLLVRNIIKNNIRLKKNKSIVESIMILLESYLKRDLLSRQWRRSERIWLADVAAKANASGLPDYKGYQAIRKKNTKKLSDMKYYEKEAEDELTRFNKLKQKIFKKNLEKAFTSKKITKKTGGTKKKKKRKKTKRKKTRKKKTRRKRKKKKKKTRRKK